MDPRLTALLAIQKKALSIITDIDAVCGGNFNDLGKPVADLAYSLESNEEAFANGTLKAEIDDTYPPTLGAYAARIQPIIDALQRLPQTQA
jgi:hypothetical protein